MSNILQVLLALFGAAFLGSVIGWCARRIVALKDERYLIEQHSRSMEKLDNSLQESEAARRRSQANVARLETQVGEMDMLNETLSATESDLAELRSESAQYKQRLEEKDDAIRKVNNELQTQKLIARNAENEKQLVLERATSRAKTSTGLRRNPISRNTSASPLANASPASSRGPNTTLPESVKPEAYQLGSLYDQDVESEIDSDIADMTADISALLDEEERQGLAADISANTFAGAGVSSNSGAAPVATPRLNKGVNKSTDTSAAGSDRRARRSTPKPKPTGDGEKHPEVAQTHSSERRGLFSAFNRKKKH